MIVRLAASEGARLRAVRLRALSDAPSAFATTLEEALTYEAQRWQAQAAALPTFIWHEGDADLGMVRGAAHDRDPTSAYLLSLWVAPEARGRGAGRALVHAVIAWAQQQGYQRLLLDVGEANHAARSLYQRCGFTVDGPAEACGCELRMVRLLSGATTA